MKKVPLFLFEEHHEAFFVWNYSVMNKLIEPFGNLLLHVDEHSDMCIPQFTDSINSVTKNLRCLYEFTYSQLTIANFIIPAVYKGIFNQLYWLYQSNNEGKLDRDFLVYSLGDEGKILKINKNYDLGMLAVYNPYIRNAIFQPITTQTESLKNKSVVLDIDLDYFSCNSSSEHYKGKLEVTEEQYNLFNIDRYHFLRFCLGGGIKSKVENGKYYLLLNSFDTEATPSKLKVSEQEIIRRIDFFVEFLIKNNLEPQIIDICRSRLSGFTPEDQWEFIEEKLLEKLSALYALEINHIGKIFAQEKIQTANIMKSTSELAWKI